MLGIAFLLHDAAMGLAAYHNGPAEVLGKKGWRDLLVEVFRKQRGRWPTDAELDNPPPSVWDAATSAAIGETHARQAGNLVSKGWRSREGTPYLLLDDAHLRDWYGPSIAELVESHWWSVERVSVELHREIRSPPWLPDWRVDLLKLACLLRLADAAQVDARRAPTLLLLIRRPQGESRDHWRFQQYLSRPELHGDLLDYTTVRPFDRPDANAWWLALDYLKMSTTNCVSSTT